MKSFFIRPLGPALRQGQSFSLSSILIFLCISGLSLGASSQAADTGAPTCSSLNTPNDVVQCALLRHPDILRAQSLLNQGTSLEAIARQRLNPELSSRVLGGTSSGETSTTAEVNLSHVFELGGKRDARLQRAKAERGVLSTELLKVKEEVYLSTLLSLHRLRQVQAELHLLDEALGTFTRIQKIYKSRPGLNPEQKVSVGVFQLASGESDLRKVVLESERKMLIRSIGIAIGGTFVPSGKTLPPAQKNWPTIAKTNAEISNASIQEARSRVGLATSELNLAKSNAWPDLRLGPSAEIQKTGSVSETLLGVNLTMPLPIYQSNQAGKAYAQQGIENAERNLRITESALQLQRDALVEQYEASVAALKKAAGFVDIEKKHKSMEDLFRRGLVPSALVIESHRQILEFIKSQHEMELSSVEALVKVYAIEGRLFEENL